MRIENHKTPNSQHDLQGSFVYDGVLISPIELFERYRDSEHGQHHAGQRLRFSQDTAYHYESLEQFLEDLGDDVHPVRHMIHTHDAITVPLLVAQREHHEGLQFTPDQEAELRTTAVLHDIGECTHGSIEKELGFTPEGDVKYGTEGVLDRKVKEQKIRAYMYEKYFTDLPARLLARVDEIDFKQTDDLAVEAFDVIERLGYFTTARRAADIVIREQAHFIPGDDRISQLGRLAVIVSHNHYPVLRRSQYTFPYVKQALDKLVLLDP
jgi:hypothetical protein